MTKFTPEIIEIVKTQFASFDIEMGEVKSRLTTLYEQPFMGQFTDETERALAAINVLKAQIIAQKDTAAYSNSKTLTMRIEGKEEVVAFKRRDGEESYRSNLFVTALIEGEGKFGQVTIWGDANEMHPSLRVGKTYIIPAVVNGTEPLSISINESVDLEVSDEVIPPMVECIKRDFTPISIGEMENNISRDYNDPKLVKGTVLSTWMMVTKNETNMGFLKIVGDDAEEITVVKFSRSADQVMLYGTGSMVYALGQITGAVVGDDGLEKFPVGMWGSIVIPILVIPPDPSKTPGIETSETPIVKPNGETTGFTVDDVDGW